MEERVQKIISNAGFCSRRKAETLIEQGRVKVNGDVIRLGNKADITKDKITVDGKTIERQRHEYYLFHKPARYLTTLSDPSGKRTISEFLPRQKRIVPVGRLDYFTEGALLLTTDGNFLNKVTHPRYEVEKTYRIYTTHPIDEAQLKKINHGLIVEGRRVDAKGRFVTAHRNIIDITIHEGRNRIIRNMMELLGIGITQLVRISIGPVRLGTLPPGKMRKLEKEEILFFLNEDGKR